MGQYIKPIISTNYLSLSGGTVSGDTYFSQNLSAETIFSGSTNLYNIFELKGSGDITRVQPGNNIITGGTGNNPIINLVDSPSMNNLTVSGNTNLYIISASTIFSGSTNLYGIFAEEFDIIDCGTF